MKGCTREERIERFYIMTPPDARKRSPTWTSERDKSFITLRYILGDIDFKPITKKQKTQKDISTLLVTFLREFRQKKKSRLMYHLSIVIESKCSGQEEI